MEKSHLNLIISRGVGTCNLCLWSLTKRKINKLNHIENGNIGHKKPKIIKKFKIVHLNKGSKFLTNSNELLNELIIKEDPDIFSLAESNINFTFMRKKFAQPLKITILS